jgi:hypothetical protein
MLLTWMSVDAAHEDDFNRWFDREHIEERVRIPGFESGTRYRNRNGTRRYLGLYRTTSVAVFESAPYRNAFQHQTDWSVMNLHRMQNAMRRVCSIHAETGVGTGGWLAIVRLGTTVGEDDYSSVATLSADLIVIDGVVSARLLVPDVTLSTPLPAEPREGRLIDPLLLVDAVSESAAEAAASAACEKIGVTADSISVLQLMWQLRQKDLHD